jgi:hypothetical protein
MKPKQFFFVVLGIVVLAVGGGGVGYYYAYGYMHQQSGVLANKLAEQQAAEKQIESLQALKVQYDHNIVPILPLIDNALPHNKKQTEILAQIERIAAEVGVIQPFESVTMPGAIGLPSEISQTNKVGTVLALQINFTAKGSTSQLQTFTSRLETLNRYTDVISLSIKHETKKEPTAYAFSLNAYIKP